MNRPVKNHEVTTQVLCSRVDLVLTAPKPIEEVLNASFGDPSVPDL